MVKTTQVTIQTETKIEVPEALAARIQSDEHTVNPVVFDFE